MFVSPNPLQRYSSKVWLVRRKITVIFYFRAEKKLTQGRNVEKVARMTSIGDVNKLKQRCQGNDIG